MAALNALLLFLTSQSIKTFIIPLPPVLLPSPALSRPVRSNRVIRWRLVLMSVRFLIVFEYHFLCLLLIGFNVSSNFNSWHLQNFEWPHFICHPNGLRRPRLIYAHIPCYVVQFFRRYIYPGLRVGFPSDYWTNLLTLLELVHLRVPVSILWSAPEKYPLFVHCTWMPTTMPTIAAFCFTGPYHMQDFVRGQFYHSLFCYTIIVWYFFICSTVTPTPIEPVFASCIPNDIMQYYDLPTLTGSIGDRRSALLLWLLYQLGIR